MRYPDLVRFVLACSVSAAAMFGTALGVQPANPSATTAPSAIDTREVPEGAAGALAAAAESAVRKEIASYLAAFNAHDARLTASHWTLEGVYVSQPDSERVAGREAIERDLETLFAEDTERKLALSTESIEFISPGVALERGKATVTTQAGETVASSYRTIYLKQGDRWLIDRVTEEIVPEVKSNYEKLKGLEWIIGNWVDPVDGKKVKIECSWTRNKNYISRAYTISAETETESSGLQIIGWDPKQKEIRSWLFDSSGTFVFGTWHQQQDRWVVPSVATFADGTTGSFTSIFKPLEDGNYTWQKVNQVIDGEILPNIDEVIISRE